MLVRPSSAVGFSTTRVAIRPNRRRREPLLLLAVVFIPAIIAAATAPSQSCTGGSARRVRGGACGAAGDDRLSALPDCLLHAIMSFLKARQVVQKSLLSKRLTHLWRSVPCLDLDDHDTEFRAPDNNHRREVDNMNMKQYMYKQPLNEESIESIEKLT
jgi:hypothetical protein